MRWWAFAEAIGSAAQSGRAGARRSFRSSISPPNERWTLRINDGLPWWIFDKSRRVPGTQPRRISAAVATAAGRGRCAGWRRHRLLGPALSPAGASVAARGAEHRAARGLGGAGVGGGARDAGGGRPGVPAADRTRRARPDLHRAGDQASPRAQCRGAARPRVARAALCRRPDRGARFRRRDRDARRRRRGHSGGAAAMRRRRLSPICRCRKVIARSPTLISASTCRRACRR